MATGEVLEYLNTCTVEYVYALATSVTLSKASLILILGEGCNHLGALKIKIIVF
jgi:hypothetical protein